MDDLTIGEMRKVVAELRDALIEPQPPQPCVACGEAEPIDHGQR